MELSKGHVFPIVLGGAQLGMKYGIANNSTLSPEEVFEMLHFSERAGINLIDTAKSYGESEKIISSYLKKNPQSSLRVVSKFHSSKDPFEESCQERLNFFGAALFGILFHDPEALDSNDLEEKVVWGKSIGIAHFGVSVYTEEQFLSACNTEWVSVIQAPFNVWDWNLEKSGLLQKAHKMDKIVILRSLLLQGILTLPVNETKAKLPQAHDYAVQWEVLCYELGKEKNIAALEFAFTAAKGCGFVIGCDDIKQLKKNLEIYQGSDRKVYDHILSKRLFLDVPDVVTKPYLWARHL